MNRRTLLTERTPALGWGDTWKRLPRLLGLTLGFVAVASAIYLQAGLGQWSPRLEPVGRSLALVVGFFFLPSLAEELLWRWLLIPPIHLGRLNLGSLRSILVSTILFTAAHPVAGWFFVPHAWEVFSNAWFLSIVFLLGLTCSTAYVWSRSIWPPVVIHWATVLAWKFLLGGPFVLLGRQG